MEELALDIFETDDFKPTTMTEMVGDIDVVPGEIEARGWFVKKPIRTETVTFIKKDRTLELVASRERGSPEHMSTRQARSAIQIEGPAFGLRDRISAREAANLLSPVLPYAVRLDNANELVAERQQDQIDRIGLTREVLRFGALQGKLYDADGTTLIADFYELFDIPEPAEIALNIAGTAAGQLRQKIENLIVRPMRRALKGRWRNGVTRVHALVGDAFWADLLQHNDIREMYLATANARELGDPTAWGTFEFGGVVWENWYGEDYDELAIATDKARFFPVGAYDTFFEFLCPGENWEDIGQPGQEYSSAVSPDNRPNLKQWVDVYTWSYPFPVMKAPQALMRARRGA